MSKTVERWRPVLGLEGRYLISDQGSVMNCKTGRRLRLCPCGRGYLRLSLQGEGGAQNRWLHRMLLESFARPPEVGEVARHLNDDKLDNRLENLAWGTWDDNMADALRNGRVRFILKRKGSLTPEQQMEVVASVESCRVLARRYGVSLMMVQRTRARARREGLVLPSAKRRSMRRQGEKTEPRRLTPEQKLEVIASGESCRALARRYSVSPMMIQRTKAQARKARGEEAA